MKRRFLLLLALGAVVAIGLLWFHAGSRSANHAGLNGTAATTTVVTNHLVAAAVAAKPAPGFLTGTNRLSFRLSNTPKSLKQLLQDPHAILLQNALIDTKAGLAGLNIPQNLQAKGDPGAYIVQARGPTSPAFRALLQSAGAGIVSYIPNNAYLVQISPAVAGALGASPLVQAVLPYQPYYKLQPTLLALATADVSLPPATMLTVGLFKGADASELYAAGYVPVGVPDQSPWGIIVHVLPPLNQPLSQLASLPGVQAIELGHSRAPANDLARVTLGISADSITSTNWLNLSGKNVTVEVNDSGVDAAHPDFSLSGTAESGPSGPTRVTGDLASSLADINGHGTHVAGIIAGNGSESTNVTAANPPQGSVTNADFRGKAPLASLYSVGGLNNGLGGGRSDQYLQEQPALTNALISNNSWVYGNDPDYDLAAASYDAATRDALPLVSGSQPVLYVFAAGDDGGGSSDGSGGTADTILSPGTAKNVITVGALEQLRDITNVVTAVINGATNSGPIWEPESDSSSQVADYSARGNVGVGIEGAFGRFKPDVVAPGSWVVSTRSQQWDTNAYFSNTNVSFINYVDQVVETNSISYYNVTVPPNAVSVTITISTNQFSTIFPANLIIYAQISGYPDPVNNPGAIDITTKNDQFAVPPLSGGAIAGIQSLQNGGFDFGIADSTNVTVNYDLTISITTTNNNGDEEQVLEGLDNGLAPWYRFETGTSMSAPAVSGTLALIQDYFTNQLSITPSPALLKAMLINGSRSVGNYTYALTNGNNFQGWGLPNIQNSLPLTSSNLTSLVSSGVRPMFFVDQSPTNALATGESHTYHVTINTNSPNEPQFLQLQATLVWTDPAGDPSAAVKLVNGLELIITNLDTGDVFVGNDINPDVGYNLPESTNAPPNIDTINNVENIIIPPLLAGNYSVTVFGRSVNVNAVTEQATNVVQDYALVVSVGEGEAPDAISTVNDQGIAVNLTSDQDLTYVATTNSPLVNQFVGANTPFLGTNQLGLGTNTVWGSTGALTLGMTNQWHFYVVTNNALDGAGLSIDVSNAAFITYDAFELSVPRMGVYEEADPANATRPEADIDLYATTDPGLTNLSPVTLSNCLAGANNSGASLGQAGTEFVYFTNSSHGQVYYVGVKSEDQMASEYDFISLFTATPFSQIQPNGDQLVNALPLPAYVPDGSPARPGVTNVFGIAIYPMQINNVVVTNLNQHQNFGDLVGTLSFSGDSAVLNNHDGYGDTLNTIVPLVYDDSRNPVPGSRHTDGPGSLSNLQGKSTPGVWILNEVDNSLTQTGLVRQLSLLITPHRDLQQPGIVVAIPPGGWFIDYVSVPPGYTNLTFYATNLPPIIVPPLEMYEKFNNEPTLTDYDFRADLTNTLVPGGAPGNSISIGPPLDIGNYYVGVYNPSTSLTANVFISANLGIDNSIHDEFNYASSGPQFVLPDAVTTASSIFVSATQLVESVNVGMVVHSPQISDLTFTLVSPTGQRILLMENRGAFDANGAGATFVYTNVLNSTAAGGAGANTNSLTVPITGTTVPITYNMYAIPDEMTVYDGNNPASFYLGSPAFLYDTGFTNLTGSFTVATQPGYTNITIIMNQFGNPYATGGGDAWIYTAGSAATNYEYLTFTDDSNLADVPIKFAVPPFGFSPTNPPDYTLSGFDAATNGLYFAPTNIYDPRGGWSVPTNIATIATVLNPTNGLFFTVTNNLVLTNNFVSVVTDPADTVGDNVSSNLLALAQGTITRSIPTVPGNIYNVTFWYRGPGIASWWRGEGNASDSSDPENNGNNGTLLGSFNFPAGEVDQAFQFENGGNEFMFAATNSYVQVPPSASLNVGTASGFTVEGWINPTNVARPQPLVEWLAAVPTNSAVTNLVIKAGPYIDTATGNYYYLLGATDWVTSEQWAEDLGGHLATISTANLQNWVFDNFASSTSHNRNLWIGLTNVPSTTNFAWSSGQTNITYANWFTNPPGNLNLCGTSIYAGILGATNAQPGLWVLANDNGVDCNNVTNVFYGVAEVPVIQPNGVQFWISATNTPDSTNAPFATAYGSLYANIVDTNFVAHEIYSPPGLLTNYVFQHVALTYDTNSGIANLYLNGTNVATTNFGAANPGAILMPKTDGDVLLGHDLSHGTNNDFGGLMDEMSVYRRALSPAEILSIYQVSAFSTNRLVGKFDPSVTPAYGLAEALVSFGGATNVLFGVNNQWELNSYTFTASSNSMPLTISGLEPGILLDDFQVSQAPATNLYFLPEQDLSALTGDSANGNWTLQVWDNLNGLALTNLSEIVSWDISLVLQSNATFAASLAPESPTPGTIPAGQTVFYQVIVPSWAHFATNILVSSTLPVNLFFNPTNTPTGTGPGDQTLLNSSTNGVSAAITVNTNNLPYPPLQAGSIYYLGVQNTNAAPAQIVLQVDYDIPTLTNGAPYSAAFGTNDTARYYQYIVGSNAYEATFQLLKLSGNADLVVSQGIPLPTLTNSAYGSFNVSHLDQNIYVLTNSTPVPLGPGTWYLGVIKRDSGVVNYSVLAQELDVTNGVVTNSVNIIPLASGVPVNFNAGPGADLTNFYAFTLAASTVSGVTNYGVLFELYNLTGNGDLTVQTNSLPLAPPFFQTSQHPGLYPESILIFTNAGFTNLNLTYYLGVPSHETNNIDYTIVAWTQTNAYFPAFPGANGAGGGAIGAGHVGTPATVYHVTTLADSGAGSLRDAVSATNRTVVFDVAGIINLASSLVITNSDLTIAGQSAPGVGITVAGNMTSVTNAHDIIIRDIRFRRGSADDSLQFLDVSNSIADHVSAEWTSDNLLSVLASTNITVQWSMLAQSLYTPTNPTAIGSLLRDGSGAVSFDHNLYADNYAGSPRLGDNLTLDFVNNVVYDWGTNSGFAADDSTNNPGGYTNRLNYTCNYLIASTNSLTNTVAFYALTTNTWIFETNNFIDSNTNGILDGANTRTNMFAGPYVPVGRSFTVSPVPTDEAFLAYEKVLDFGGVDLYQRDYFDTGIVGNVRTQSGTLISTPPLAGMVAWWRGEDNTLDSIGSNNGTWVGTTSYTNGEVGQAFDFNGPAGASHVQVLDAPALDFTNTMTVEAWVNVRTYAGAVNEYEIVSKAGGVSTLPGGYTFSVAASGPNNQEAYFIENSATSFGRVYSAAILPTNQWVHLAGVDDGSQLEIYVNGVLSGTAPSTPAIAVNPNPLVIGCTLQAGGVATSWFNGQIDEVSLYKRALSSNEIAYIYNAGAAGKFGWYSNSLAKPYLDTDQDGLPDFWENTVGQPPYVPSNNNPSTNAPGYTTLEEYNKWQAAPHALTITNKPVGVDLQRLFGGSGRLSFLATNAVHGFVYLTNVLGAFTNTAVFSKNIAVFVPTNTTPAFTGYASFDAYVTNYDTVAYFGPVTVSVVVSPAPVIINSNFPPVITPLAALLAAPGGSPSPGGSPAVSGAAVTATNYYGSDYYVVAVTNMGTMSPVAVLFTVTNESGPVDLVANYGDNLPLPSLSSYEFISTNPWPAGQNILISSNSTPVAVTNGNWYLAVVNVAGSSVSYTINATELFSVLPPLFLSPTNAQVFTNVATFPFSYNCVATDPNSPPLPLTFALASGPTNLTVTSGGVINWTPTLQQGPTTNGPSTNAVVISVSNGNYFVTNTFSIIVLGTNIPPTLPVQPNQVVIVPNGTLLVTNTGTNLNLPAYPLVYMPVNYPAGAAIDANGIITWTPTLGQAGSNYVFTTICTDTNPWAVNATSLSVTNSFVVTVVNGLLPGAPQTNTVLGGSLDWIAVAVPANAIIATNTLLFATNLPVNLWFSTNIPPTITNSADAELLINSSGGSRVLLTNGAPAFVPGGVYFLGVQNTNALNVTYALKVTFDLAASSSNVTNGFKFHGITHTTINGTNGYLLAWFAPSNDLFTVQWTTSLVPANWVSFTNIVGYNGSYPANATNAEFTFFDDGSHDGGLGLNHFYRLILLGQQSLADSIYLPSQSDLVVGPQTTFSVTNTAVDSNPYAVVTYSLLTAPAGAVINGANGVITWTTPSPGIATTNVFTTVATDNGSPAAHATNSFRVLVVTQPNFSSEHLTANGLLLTWFAPAAELFQVEWRTNLISGPWTLFTNIISFNPTAFTSPGNTQFNFLDDGTQSGPFSIPHYYQLILLPSELNPSQTSPVISGVIPSASGTTLHWIAPGDEIFKVQWTSNLNPPVVWVPFSNFITSSSTNYSFTDTNTASLMRFYELLLLP